MPDEADSTPKQCQGSVHCSIDCVPDEADSTQERCHGRPHGHPCPNVACQGSVYCSIDCVPDERAGLNHVERASPPRADGILFQDPRRDHPSDVGVIGFYYPDYASPIDTICNAGFCGNFWIVRDEDIVVTAKGEAHRFTNAESAFQALKFWDRAHEFESKSGLDAFRLKRSLAGHEDFTYADTGGNWQGMIAVLRIKFAAGSSCAELLQQTQDAFLIEHNSVQGRDMVWSNNADGEGANWLGMQLMLLRDELTASNKWTTFIQHTCAIDTVMGPGTTPIPKWQQAVRDATSEIYKVLQGADANMPE